MIPQLPRYDGNADRLSQVQKIMPVAVDYLNERVKRVRWNNSDYESKLAQRSPREVLADGKVGFMNCCFDYMGVLNQILKCQGFPLNAVMHLHTRNGRGVGIHMGLEDRAGQWHVDLNANHLIVERGPYRYHEERSSPIRSERIPGEVFPFDRSPFKALGFNSFRDVEIRYHPFSFRQNLERLKQDNTEETWNVYLALNKGDPKIRLNII